MDYEVTFSNDAEADLIALHDFIFDNSGMVRADRYIGRIYDVCHSLAMFPERGQPRGDLSAGLRTIPFERRALIAYKVDGARVVIARIFYAGRDYENELAES
jgi:toxin ParE1/3/4